VLFWVQTLFWTQLSFWVWSHLENLEKAAKEMARMISVEGHYMVITANPATYDARKGFYSSYEEQDGLIVGNFDLGDGKQLSNSTLYLHSREAIENALRVAGLEISNIESVGMLDDYPKGLYLVIDGKK